jgi:hypothetical protein
MVFHVLNRGVGPTVWDPSEKKQTQIRRWFLLLGQTLDGMKARDVRRAISALRSVEELGRLRPVLAGRGVAGGIALFAAIFEPDVAGLELESLPAKHRRGAILLNVARCLDMPQAVALAAQRCPVRLLGGVSGDWEFPRAAARQLGWGDARVSVASEASASPAQTDAGTPPAPAKNASPR